MAKQFKKQGPRLRHYLASWRTWRGLRQHEVADRLNCSESLVSRIEAGCIPYSQDFLEAYAEVMDCTPADLVSRDPTAAESFILVWGSLNREQQSQGLRLLRALKNE